MHEEFTARSGVQVYFADPRSPWQRPSNENTNGLIREFFPKTTNLKTVNHGVVNRTQALLNARPRKTLHFHLPKDLFEWLSENPEKHLSDYPFEV